MRGAYKSGGESLRNTARIYQMIHYEQCTDSCWLRGTASGDSLADLRMSVFATTEILLKKEGKKHNTDLVRRNRVLLEEDVGSGPNGGASALQKQHIFTKLVHKTPLISSANFWPKVQINHLTPSYCSTWKKVIGSVQTQQVLDVCSPNSVFVGSRFRYSNLH